MKIKFLLIVILGLLFLFEIQAQNFQNEEHVGAWPKEQIEGIHIKKSLADDATRILFKVHSFVEDQSFSEGLMYIDSLPDKMSYALWLRAKVYMGLRKYRKAADYFLAYNKSLKSASEHSDNYNLGICYFQLGQPDSAFICFKRNLESAHKLYSIVYESEPLLSDFRKTDWWKKLWKQEFYSSEEKSLEQAIYYRNKKELNLALDILDDLIINNKKFSKAYYYRALYLIELNKDYSSAVKDMKKAVKLEPVNYRYNRLLAELYLKKLKYSKALKYAQLALELSPYNRADCFRLAKLYYHNNQYDLALKYSRFSLYLKPSLDLYRTAGFVCFDSHRYEEALSFFEEASQRYTRRLELIVPKVRTLMELERYEDANYEIGSACDLDPENGELWFLKGLAKLYKGEKDAACQYFRKANYLNYPQASRYLLRECQ